MVLSDSVVCSEIIETAAPLSTSICNSLPFSFTSTLIGCDDLLLIFSTGNSVSESLVSSVCSHCVFLCGFVLDVVSLFCCTGDLQAFEICPFLLHLWQTASLK